MTLEQIVQTIDQVTPLLQAHIQSLGIVYAGLTVAFFVLIERVDKVLETVEWSEWHPRIYAWSSRAVIGLYAAFFAATVFLGSALFVDTQIIGLKGSLESSPVNERNVSVERLSKLVRDLQWWNASATNAVLLLLLICAMVSMFISLVPVGEPRSGGLTP